MPRLPVCTLSDVNRALLSELASASLTNAAPITDPEIDPAIEVLNLQETARKAAYLLKKAHPSVIFTSGRRDKAAQARAMASNVVIRRDWIACTYVPSEARDQCQNWVDNHAHAKTLTDLEAGLTGVLDSLTDALLARLSKHLAGDAFDVQPVVRDADAIKQTIRSLPGLSAFLEREGGLVRWPAQF